MSPHRLPEILVGRSPVLDRHQALVGYELLFWQNQDGSEDFAHPRRADAEAICKAFAELGLASALGGQRPFIGFDAASVCSEAVELLPRQTVLQVEAAALDAGPVLDRCRELHAAGYEICITGVVAVTDDLARALPVASYLKVDAGALADPVLEELAGRLCRGQPKTIAGGVDSMGRMARCAELGFSHFEGYYFAKPGSAGGRRLDAPTRDLLEVISLLNRDEDISKIEAAMKHQPALAVNLLRLTNSVGVGLPVHVTSMRHAITVVGRRQLLRWLQLLLFSRGGGEGIGDNPLMQLAALRGYFMELLATRSHPGRRELRELAFITGLMSLLPAALGLPMEEILGQIAVAAEARQALILREGELGPLLELSERYDANDPAGTGAILSRLDGLSPTLLGECLSDAIAWVQKLDTPAGT